MAKGDKKSNKQIASGKPAAAGDTERWLENFFGPGWLRPFRMEWPEWSNMPAVFGGRGPKVDIIDRDSEVVVRAELPGVSKDDLDISVSDNSVTIRGETTQEKKEEKGEIFHSEIARGSFLRTLPLPGTVDAANAKASFSDGILELTLPKTEQAKRQSIKID